MIVRRLAIGVVVLLLLLLVLIATFPIGWAKSRIEQRLAASVGAPVSIGSITRQPVFSFSPTILISDLRIAQPRWAGSGDFVRAGQLRLRMPLLPALIGRGLRPEGLAAQGLVVALVRDGGGRSNWQGRGRGRGGSTRLSDLVVTGGRFTLRDERRHLTLAGTLDSDHNGLRVRGTGRFHDAAATIELTGQPITGADPASPYPFSLTFQSPLLNLTATGSSEGALNFRAMALDLRARAPSLKYLDDIIQAGLFGSQPIDLTAKVRHRDRDWFVDRIGGSIGRSRFTGKAEILKRDGRAKIDADILFSQFDFDDLADAQGKAEGAALKARIGPRVLPTTRINLAKIGPTDGQIRFVAQKLLFKTESAFKSLKGTISLEGKVLTVDKVVAKLADGRMTGRVVVDHRQGVSPLLSMDLSFSDGRLGPLLGAPDKIDAPYRARVVLSGRGDTVREALGRANGHAGIAAANGRVLKIAAAVLGQDMGKTIRAALSDKGATVALRCVALGFEARGGTLTAAPFLIDTELARSRGTGTIVLDGERIALTIGGQARDGSGFAIMDPVSIGGTLTSPALNIGDIGSGKRDTGTLLGAVAKSIGGALGLAEKKGPDVTAIGPIDCGALTQRVLRGGDRG